MRAYLAGPDVFLPNAVEVGERKKEICSRYGFVGIYPLDSGVELDFSDLTKAACDIAKANEQLIRSSNVLFANLTPFRGPSADVGTVYEMGYARGHGLKVFGYTNSIWKYVERMHWILGSNPAHNERGELLDSEGMFVEAFGMWDNLMLDSAIIDSGAQVVALPAEERGRFLPLEGFELCVARAAAQLGLDCSP